jgi:hypothetical protein
MVFPIDNVNRAARSTLLTHTGLKDGYGSINWYLFIADLTALSLAQVI